MLENLTAWLAGTDLSVFIQEVAWIIPTTQSIHILAIAAVMFAVLSLNLRVLGIAGRSQSVAAMVGDFMPWVWAALVILLCTGIILIIGEPARELMNTVFRTKMVLVLCVAVLAFFFERKVRKDSHYWDATPARRVTAKALALVSIGLWLAILTLGRFIAYFGGVY